MDPGGSEVEGRGAFATPVSFSVRPNTDTQAEVTAFLRRVVLRHSQGMKLGANSLLGLPAISHKVSLRLVRDGGGF